MSDSDPQPTSGRFETPPTAQGHFSWINTRLGLERTMMAWIRTAVSLVGFGFTIVTFSDRLSELSAVTPVLAPTAPRYVGMALIAAGVLALVISIVQYNTLIHYLFGPEFAPVAALPEQRSRTPAVATAVVVLLIGVAAFVTVWFRLG